MQRVRGVSGFPRPALIASGRNGFLASGEREIADRLGDLVSSPALRRRMGLASRRMARRYDSRLFGSSLRGLVTTIVRKPAAE